MIVVTVNFHRPVLGPCSSSTVSRQKDSGCHEESAECNSRLNTANRANPYLVLHYGNVKKKHLWSDGLKYLGDSKLRLRTSPLWTSCDARTLGFPECPQFARLHFHMENMKSCESRNPVRRQMQSRAFFATVGGVWRVVYGVHSTCHMLDMRRPYPCNAGPLHPDLPLENSPSIPRHGDAEGD